MAKRKRSGVSAQKELLVIVASLLGAILTILGVCLDWTVYKIESKLGNSSNALKLSELKDGDGYTFMCILAYAVLVLAVLTFALAVTRHFVKSVPEFAGALSGIIAAVAAIALLIVTVVFCSNNASFSVGGLASGKMVIGIGAILSTVGGLLSGAAAVIGSKK